MGQGKGREERSVREREKPTFRKFLDPPLLTIAVYTALVRATGCNISLLPARPYFSAEYPRGRAVTGSCDNVTIIANIVADRNAKIDLYTKPYYTALIDNWRQQLGPLNKTT